MQLSSTTQRKNKITPLSNTNSFQDVENGALLEKKPRQIIATVRRRRFGTSPFDIHWLNMGMWKQAKKRQCDPQT